MNHKRIALVGPGASGKDHAKKILIERNFKPSISYTTRPPRTGYLSNVQELDSVDYFFLSEEKFLKMIKNDEFYEHTSFNKWRYGTSREQFYSKDIFIMTPHGISNISKEDRSSTFVIYFNIPEEIRRTRLLLRGDSDNVERRITADQEDFKNFTDYDMVVKNFDF